MAYWFLGAGLLLILAGGETAVRGGVGLARWFDVSPLVTGIFVVAVATSAPDLFVSLNAAGAGAPALALGGLIGTCILNILFVMGLGALLRPIASSPKVVVRDGGAMLLASVALLAVAADGRVSRDEGALLLAAFAAYLALMVATDWRRTPEHSVAQARALYRSGGEKPPVAWALFLLLLGLILLALGSHFAVAGSLALARQSGWGETFAGLTVVALALSLPKLAATFGAMVRGHAEISAGQLIEANVFDLFGVLGVTALAMPLAVPPKLASTDDWVLVAASALLLPLLAMRWRLSRPRGLLLIAAYGCYIGFVVWRQGLLQIPGLG